MSHANGWLVALLIAAVALSGAIFQSLAVRREAARYPPPGRLVDIGGRRLHLICLGAGAPTVIFESSGFGSALSAERARVEIARTTRVCSYDRAGMGWSDPGPSVLPTGVLVHDFEQLLAHAELRPPYLLVPASIGGLTSELFTRRHPGDIAGLVFLDAAQSEMLARFAPAIRTWHTAAACLAGPAARVGLLRLIDPFEFSALAPAQAGPAVARLYRGAPMDTLCGLIRGLPDSVQQMAAAPPLPADVPLTVLMAERPDRLLPPGVSIDIAALTRESAELHRRFAARSTRGSWQVVPGSDHLIGNSQPEAVARAVLTMLTSMTTTAR